ncbi:Dpy-19-like protein 3 [Plakobranchus ocellatus]|uniref:Dpy-19-like protein 3 n=1 Tax=Plakobranchus ocellatus TaxID=259542 RepID=A0AAV4DDP9_9GAST|nr:Dpy-19-like protein 3 [Plakobranchus ocellatus]
MSTSPKKRSKFFSVHDGRKDNKTNSISKSTSAEAKSQTSKEKPSLTNNHDKQKKITITVWGVANTLIGLAGMFVISGLHSWIVYQLHENNLWFTNIKEVEREISFRTEAGLYYSYYKQLVHSPSILEGIQALRNDRLTEHPDTINVLERMNIYEEVVLATVYKLCATSMEPIFFYIYSVFGLQSLLVSGLYLMAWLLSGSWLAGLISAALYIFNRLDTTRVSHSGPLRENFSLPFIWLQAAALIIYFRSKESTFAKRLSLVAVAATTFLFCLFWQFNQFIMMLQAFSLFGVWVLGLIPAHKVCAVMFIQLGSLLAVCLLQFGNTMIIGSLSVSFLLAAMPLIHYMGALKVHHSILWHLMRVAGLSVLSLVFMVVLNAAIKMMVGVNSDEHIFKFLQNKFGVGDERDFDSRLYLCLGIFGFITQDVFERLTAKWALPLYLPAHLTMLLWLAFTVITQWRSKILKQNQKSKSESHVEDDHSLHSRPELAYHTVQAVFFGGLSMLTLRMKYFWTPYVCVFAAVAVADTATWAKLLNLVHIRRPAMIHLIRVSCVLLFLSVMVQQLLPPLLEDLKVEMEFWDPDTVELMEWIVNNTKATASFTGSMQLLAGVKLCTGRPITNHPHYEDKHLRLKTKELYQIYGRRSAEDIHSILTHYNSNFIILEDSICRAPSRGGCRTPDLVDIDNGVTPDEPVNITGLVKSSVPRFCEAVRHQKPSYAKYFKMVLVNKTFRVYKVL